MALVKDLAKNASFGGVAAPAPFHLTFCKPTPWADLTPS
jgi:hypothetical protein